MARSVEARAGRPIRAHELCFAVTQHILDDGAVSRTPLPLDNPKYDGRDYASFLANLF